MSNWSYSRYGTWKKCPALLKFQMEVPEKPPTPPAAQRGLDLHKAAELFIRGDTNNLPDLLEYYREFMETLRENDAQPEYELAVDVNWEPVDFHSDDRWWRGILDCLVTVEDETIILDWKTGQEYGDHRDQREIYASAAHALNKDVQITVLHVYFDKKMNTVSIFQPREIADIRKKWERNVEDMLNDTVMAPNPGYYCRFCHFRRDNGGPCHF